MQIRIGLEITINLANILERNQPALTWFVSYKKNIPILLKRLDSLKSILSSASQFFSMYLSWFESFTVLCNPVPGYPNWKTMESNGKQSITIV